MSRYFIPTDHDADPQGIILNRLFPFIEEVVERAIERADPQDGAEDIVTAFLHSHQEELDSTFDAFVSLYRILNILPHDDSDGTDDDDSSDPSPTPSVTHTTSNQVTNSTPGTQVNGIARRLGNGTTTTRTPEDGPDDISHHGNGDNQVSTPSWVVQYRMREAQRRLNAAGSPIALVFSIGLAKSLQCLGTRSISVFLYAERRANMGHGYITEKDPGLRGTPAFVYLQECIGRAVEHALKSGTPADLVRDRFSQNQTQFDAVLGTLDAVFRLGDTQRTAAIHGDHVAATSLHIAQGKVPPSPTHLFQRPRTFAPTQYHRDPKEPALLDPSLPERTASVTAVANGGNAADSLRISDNFPDTPHFSLENSDGLRNRERHLEGVAAQRILIDEDRRAANSSMVGNWLESVNEVPDNHAQQLAKSGHDTQGDIKLPDARPNPNKRRRLFSNQVDGTAVHPSGVQDPTANSLPRTKSKSDLPSRNEYYP